MHGVKDERVGWTGVTGMKGEGEGRYERREVQTEGERAEVVHTSKGGLAWRVCFMNEEHYGAGRGVGVLCVVVVEFLCMHVPVCMHMFVCMHCVDV